MDLLDKIINEHRAEFDEEPSEGHLERFDAKLSKLNKKQVGLHQSLFLKIAAVVIIILISGDLVVHFRKSGLQLQEAQVLKSDLGEATFYSGILRKWLGKESGLKRRSFRLNRSFLKWIAYL